jgi:hypothetical protein
MVTLGYTGERSASGDHTLSQEHTFPLTVKATYPHAHTPVHTGCGRMHRRPGADI